MSEEPRGECGGIRRGRVQGIHAVRGGGDRGGPRLRRLRVPPEFSPAAGGDGGGLRLCGERH